MTDNSFKDICPRRACIELMVEQVDQAGACISLLETRVMRLRQFDGHAADLVKLHIARVENALAAMEHDLREFIE